MKICKSQFSHETSGMYLRSRMGWQSGSEVWNMRWATDNPDLFAIMEKTRMYIARVLRGQNFQVSFDFGRNKLVVPQTFVEGIDVCI